MSDPSHKPNTPSGLTPSGFPGTPVAPPARPSKGGSWLVRAIVALAAVVAVVWFLRSRHHEAGGDRAAGEAAGSGSASRRGGGGGSDEARVVPVQVASVQRKDLPIWLEGLGTVAAMQQVTVHPQVDGKLEKVLFVEGQPVKKGDLLVQIDPRPFQVALHQAQGALARDQAQLAMNQSNLKRYEGLKAQNLVAGQQVEEIAGAVGQFEGTVKVDLAQIENAQLQLDYCSVRAPLDGIAGVRQVDAGNLVHQTDANGLVVITAIDPAAVFFTLPQDQLGAVAQALSRGEVAVEAYSRDGATKLGTGTLAVLDNQINQATATLRLKALVPNPDRLLWPNAFVKARILIETRKDAVVIPMVAVQRGPQGTYVYAVGADKVAQMKPVTIALTTGDVAVVGKGLEGGEQVIIEGQNQVRPGGKVEPSSAGAGPAGSAQTSAGGGDRPHGKRGGNGGGSGSGNGSAQARTRGAESGPTASNQPAAP